MVYVVVLAGALVAAVVLYSIFVPKKDSILEPKEDTPGAFVPTQPDPISPKDDVAEVQSYNFETTADLAAETAVFTPEPTPVTVEKVKVVKKKATPKKTKGA